MLVNLVAVMWQGHNFSWKWLLVYPRFHNTYFVSIDDFSSNSRLEVILKAQHTMYSYSLYLNMQIFSILKSIAYSREKLIICLFLNVFMNLDKWVFQILATDILFSRIFCQLIILITIFNNNILRNFIIYIIFKMRNTFVINLMCCQNKTKNECRWRSSKKQIHNDRFLLIS